MAREKETFRLELEQVIQYFGQKRIISRTDVQRYTGRSRNWVINRIGPQTEFTQVDLARAMASLSGRR